MVDLKTWIEQLKSEKPEYSEFIKKLEGFISDSGFDSVKFEKAVEKGLKNIETQITESFTQKDDAQNKKDNH